MKPPRIIVITDPAFADALIVDHVRAIAEALAPGDLCVQLRDKRRSDTSLRLFALELRRVTEDAGAALVVNGRARIARDVGADGVHLGGDSGTVEAARALLPRGAWISVAAHTNDDVRRAAGDGADAVLVSPIFATRAAGTAGAGAGRDKTPRGLIAIGEARFMVEGGAAIASSSSKRPRIFALGGVTRDRVGACVRAGADGVAFIRGLLGSPSPGKETRAIIAAIDGARWAPRWRPLPTT